MPSATDTFDDTAYAQALIAREQEDARAGLRVLASFFGLGAMGSLVAAALTARSHALYAVPIVIVLALIALGMGRRVWRFTRARRTMQQAWDAGKLSDGRDALEVARARHRAS